MKTLQNFICEAFNKANIKLVYDDQISFTKAFKKEANNLFGKDLLKQKNINIDIYFDDIECVDPNNNLTIKGVTCNGKMTWSEASDKLIEYFKTTYKL